ncbi:ABC transporter permease [Actinoplanes sp. GCM10030250]|uniref:ABC transporter permease n=1 Tax=Actinoplanes sp. GCM10030250 TaxID=3273376 RepID=UPI00361ED4FA
MRPDRIRTPILDVLLQAWHAVAGRRTRSVLTAAGIGLGIAATVATIGISGAAGDAISARFDAVRATALTATYTDARQRPRPAVAESIRRLNGVREAGLLCPADQEASLSGVASGEAVERVNVIAAQPSALRALGVSIATGREHDEGHESRGDRVALLDTVAAEALHLTRLDGSPVVFLDGQAYPVIGVFEAPEAHPELTNAAVLPYRACSEGWQVFGPAAAQVRTDLGAADQVGASLRVALRPEKPDGVEVAIPADLRSFRTGVEEETRALFLGLAVVSLVIGALGVSNTTLVSVMERRPEIGLRRAVGAGRMAIAGQFLVESAVLGVAGGIAGTVIGLDVTAVVCLVKDWLVMPDPLLLVAGPAGGLLVGMLAGVYPAISAARVLPARTLRG